MPVQCQLPLKYQVASSQARLKSCWALPPWLEAIMQDPVYICTLYSYKARRKIGIMPFVALKISDNVCVHKKGENALENKQIYVKRYGG